VAFRIRHHWTIESIMKRVAGGRLQVWRAARAEIARSRRDLAMLGGFAVLWCVFFNLPWIPAYERGLFTGVGLVVVLWSACWTVWVLGGLSHRLNGVWAEDGVIDALRRHERAYAAVPSYGLHGRDIDCVLITAAAVYAVEVKWVGGTPGAHRWRGMCSQVARDMKALRRDVVSEGVPEHLVRGLLVLCGPGSRDLVSCLRTYEEQRMRIVSGRGLEGWLEGQTWGPFDRDLADDLSARLTQTASERDAAPDLSRPMRWLARTR
jgi:hypothetical protein